MLRIMLIAKKRMQEGNIRIKRTLVRKKYEHLFYADKTECFLSRRRFVCGFFCFSATNFAVSICMKIQIVGN